MVEVSALNQAFSAHVAQQAAQIEARYKQARHKRLRAGAAAACGGGPGGGGGRRRPRGYWGAAAAGAGGVVQFGAREQGAGEDD